MQIFRTSVAGRQPNTTVSTNSQYIAAGQLALNMSDQILYTSNGSTLIVVGANLPYLAVSGTSYLSGVVTIGANTLVTGTVNSSSFTIGTTFIANTTILTFTPNTFNLGSSNVAAAAASNGYICLPNGLKMAWGSVLVNSTAKVITFSTNTGATFSSNTLAVTATSNTAGATYQPAITTINSTAISIITANTANTTVYWHAIGK
jgi:hypothetical protein